MGANAEVPRNEAEVNNYTDEQIKVIQEQLDKLSPDDVLQGLGRILGARSNVSTVVITEDALSFSFKMSNSFNMLEFKMTNMSGRLTGILKPTEERIDEFVSLKLPTAKELVSEHNGDLNSYFESVTDYIILLYSRKFAKAISTHNSKEG